MRTPTPLTLVLLTFAVFAASCDKAPTEADGKPTPNAQRLMLNQGYSMLYSDASKIGLANLVLYVKIESDPFDELLTEISSYGSELKRDLKRIARDYPEVRIDLDPLPVMETRKRTAIGRNKAIRFAPLAGGSRTDYERSMLISLSNALNHESHLAQVLAAEEPEPALKKFLLASEKRYGELTDLALDLLDREHFKNDSKPSQKP